MIATVSVAAVIITALIALSAILITRPENKPGDEKVSEEKQATETEEAAETDEAEDPKLRPSGAASTAKNTKQ